jgi:ABC-type lipoprotein release transport system permease subunit
VALAGLLTRFTVIGRLDLPILAGIAILHLAIALAATYVPARRAFQLDAMRALGTN